MVVGHWNHDFCITFKSAKTKLRLLFKFKFSLVKKHLTEKDVETVCNEYQYHTELYLIRVRSEFVPHISNGTIHHNAGLGLFNQYLP